MRQIQSVRRFLGRAVRVLRPKKPPAPRAIKQQTVRDYGQRYSIGVLIETGTYLGYMAAAAKDWFEVVHTIELDPGLAQKATELFRGTNVKVYEGDSSVVLPQILDALREPALFWLDAHYSGGITARGDTNTPIARELDSVVHHPFARVVLIDDARVFGQGDYPRLKTIRKKARASGWNMEVDMDIIRLTR